jgi:ABC-2 type transport system permease protein
MMIFAGKCFAFLKRDLLENLSYKSAVLFDVLSVLAHLVTFFFITKLIGAGAGVYLKEYGGSYFPFVLTGIAFSGFSASALTAFSSAVIKEQSTGTLEAILVTPTSPWTVMGASFVWTFLASLAEVALYLVLGAGVFHVDFSRINVPASVIFLLLTVVSLSGPGLLSAAFTLVFKRGDPVSYFFNAGSRFLAGVYFPISLLPTGLQRLSGCLPLTYSLRALRGAVMGGKGVGDLGHELVALLLFSLICLPVSVVLFNRALSRAKKEGSLSFV